jgi:thiol:disulfide interchange protein DsbD
MLVAIAFLAWAHGSGPRSNLGGPALVAVALALVFASGAWTWRSLQEEPAAVASTHPQLANASGGTRWQRWSPDAVAQALAAGRPVFVDFTAAWCVTCQVNKRVALHNQAVLEEFALRKVVPLRADWTRQDPRITATLAALGRNAVPVYALYLPGEAAPRLLPELLTPSLVLAELARIPAGPAIASSLSQR